MAYKKWLIWKSKSRDYSSYRVKTRVKEIYDPRWRVGSSDQYRPELRIESGQLTRVGPDPLGALPTPRRTTIRTKTRSFYVNGIGCLLYKELAFILLTKLPSIKGGYRAITDLVDAKRTIAFAKQLRHIKKLFFLSQIINNHQELLDWSTINIIYSAGRKPAHWYKHVSNKIRDGSLNRIKHEYSTTSTERLNYLTHNFDC